MSENQPKQEALAKPAPPNMQANMEQKPAATAPTAQALPKPTPPKPAANEAAKPTQAAPLANPAAPTANAAQKPASAVPNAKPAPTVKPMVKPMQKPAANTAPLADALKPIQPAPYDKGHKSNSAMSPKGMFAPYGTGASMPNPNALAPLSPSANWPAPLPPMQPFSAAAPEMYAAPNWPTMPMHTNLPPMITPLSVGNMPYPMMHNQWAHPNDWQQPAYESAGAYPGLPASITPCSSVPSMEQVLQTVSPSVYDGLSEAMYRGVPHAMTRTSAIAYLMGAGYTHEEANNLALAWEQQSLPPTNG